jgi:hypothetical protein
MTYREIPRGETGPLSTSLDFLVFSVTMSLNKVFVSIVNERERRTKIQVPSQTRGALYE